MYNKRMSKIYDDCLKRFNDTKDYDDRACLEDIITHFQRFVGEANPHLFTIMYLDGHYEDYVTFGPMNMRKEYEDYTVANKDFFTNIFNHFTNLELKEEVNNKTFVPNTSEIVEDFLKTVDMDLYNLFINYLLKQRIMFLEYMKMVVEEHFMTLLKIKYMFYLVEDLSLKTW